MSPALSTVSGVTATMAPPLRMASMKMRSPSTIRSACATVMPVALPCSLTRNALSSRGRRALMKADVGAPPDISRSYRAHSATISTFRIFGPRKARIQPVPTVPNR